MFRVEAKWISDQLSRFSAAEISPLVNLGSSTGGFRTQHQPWIDKTIFQPLVERGVTVIHSDIKDQPGVDLVCDILTPQGKSAISKLAPMAVICCNLLEHVEDPGAMLTACLSVLSPGGVLIVSVPRSYPYHRDPIDTMYRPAPEEIARLMGGSVEVCSTATLETGSYRDNVRARPLILLRPLFRLPVPFLGFQKWKRSLGKLYWLISPYKVSCLVVRKRPASDQPADHRQRDA